MANKKNISKQVDVVPVDFHVRCMQLAMDDRKNLLETFKNQVEGYLYPEDFSKYVFYDKDHGYCVNTMDVIDILDKVEKMLIDNTR